MFGLVEGVTARRVDRKTVFGHWAAQSWFADTLAWQRQVDEHALGSHGLWLETSKG